MEALKILSMEHQNILKVISALNQEIDSLNDGKGIDEDFFKKTILFVREYADKFHHAKEEDILFKELEKDGVLTHCNPVQQMLHEHGLGRDFIKNLEEGINEKNRGKVIENAKGYVLLLQEHITKEDNILFPMANESLSSEIKENMIKAFEQVEQEQVNEKNKHLDFVKGLN